jgi:hypothetical protein
MKSLAVLCFLLLGISQKAYSEIKIAYKDTTYQSLCFHANVLNLKGFAQAMIVGNCFDVAVNGMSLSLVAMKNPSDPEEAAVRVELGQARNISIVENKEEQIQISIEKETYDQEGNFLIEKKVIYVRTVDADDLSFSVVEK